MKRILLIAFLCISYLGFSQTLKPMTWSGIITDNSGNPLQNTNVNLKFSIFLDNIETYSETQTQTTDDNGFITANIGTGTAVVGNYDSTFLTTLDSKLKIEADTGSGFVTLQDSPITAVPMAKTAEVAYVLRYEDNSVNVAGSDIYFVRDNQSVATFDDDGLRLTSLIDFGASDNVTVEVTPSGILQRGTPETPQEKYLSISAADFVNEDDGIYYHPASGLYNVSGNTIPYNVNRNIYLPHGATITNIKAVFIDNSVASNFFFSFRRHDNTSPGWNEIETISTGQMTESGTTQIFDTDDFTPVNHTVDNINYSYYLKISTAPNWSDLSDEYLTFKRILITYEE
ncbi:MAG: hypothetical protein ACK5M1_04935 [Xanthomarina gelatinilytica]|uniref:hypothetical protein n=1 Tax=Xanthomarina gelatinilytica TaxID=1137281 RepID=UPI003A8404E3